MKKQAVLIVQKLQDAGFEAYFAGGGVRDLLLGLDPKDIDIATSAKPEEVEKLFSHTIPVGKQFGIIIVREKEQNYDVATFREESGYEDNRRPSKISFSTSEQDAKRRDFTMNGIFLDPIKNKTLDFVGGQEDIKRRLVRFIGDAQERISEDHLRILRAVRFKITLNFQFEENTLKAVRKNVELIRSVSAERIRNELNKIMESKNRSTGLVELSESGILNFILPELEDLKGVAQPPQYHKEGDVFTHTYLALKSLPKDASLHLTWATLLHDIAKPQTEIRENDQIIFHDHAKASAIKATEILKRLKFSKIEISTISWLIDNHMRIAQIESMRPGKKAEFLLDHRFGDLLELARADTLGTYPPRLEMLDEWQKSRDELIKQKKEYTIKHKKLAIFTGDDLIAIGVKPDNKFKVILEKVRDKILTEDVSSKEEAIAYAKTLI